MKIRKFAAIDIGSNSLRLLIANVLENGEGPLFKKSSLIRVPVRLGANAFTGHRIPELSVSHLVETMTAFRFLMKANEVIHYKGCATAAMREAVNGKQIVERIKSKSKVTIEIISGTREAALIYNSQFAALSKMNGNGVFVDVGGGSTEITIFSKGKPAAAKSFPIGTIRILQNQVTKDDWKKLKRWIEEKSSKLKSLSIIGSGGNINRLSKMVNLKPGKPMTFDTLDDITDELKHYSFNDRIKLFDLNPDRADVIVPAGEIFLSIIKIMDADKIYVPKIGLGDGIVREAYKEYLEGKRSRFE